MIFFFKERKAGGGSATAQPDGASLNPILGGKPFTFIVLASIPCLTLSTERDLALYSIVPLFLLLVGTHFCRRRRRGHGHKFLANCSLNKKGATCQVDFEDLALDRFASYLSMLMLLIFHLHHLLLRKVFYLFTSPFNNLSCFLQQ